MTTLPIKYVGFKYKLTRAAGVFSAFNVADGRYSGHAIMYSLEHL